MSRLAEVNRVAVDLLHNQGYTPSAIADTLGLALEVVHEHLGIERQPMRTVVWDLEMTNLRSDIGTLLVGSFFDLGTGEMVTHTIGDDPYATVQDREASLVQAVRDEYVEADILIGFNSLAFDKNWLQGASARHGFAALPNRFHIDCYLVARYGMKGLLQSLSLDNLADFFGMPPKDRPSKHEWREAALLDDDAVSRIAQRCESDVLLTAQVWTRLRPYWFKWRGQ